MTAIIRKEMRSYFTSILGYVFLTAIVSSTGTFFVLNNVMSQSASFAVTLSDRWFMFLILILIPVLTMRLFAEEAKQKTDQLLYTSPLTINQIVIGKFIAAVLLFLIGIAITIIFPVIMTQYGDVSFAETVGAYIGFILLGVCFISVGLFISALTSDQIVAAIASFAVLFIFYVLDPLASGMPADRVSSAIFIAVIVLVIAFAIFDSTKNIYAAIIFSVICLAIGIAAYFVNNLLFDRVIYKVLGWFSVLKRFSNFSMGILNLSDVVYYLTFSCAFVYLTTSAIEKRRWK